MSIIKEAKKWASMWSNVFTDATNSKITLQLSPRYTGKAYFILQRLKKPRMIRAFKKIVLYEARLKKITCSRKHIRRRVVK